MSATAYEYPRESPPTCPSAGRPPFVPPIKTTFASDSGGGEWENLRPAFNDQVYDFATRYTRLVNNAGAEDREWVLVGSATWLKTLENLIQSIRLLEEDKLPPSIIGKIQGWKFEFLTNQEVSRLIRAEDSLRDALRRFNLRCQVVEPGLILGIDSASPSEIDQNASDSTSDE